MLRRAYRRRQPDRWPLPFAAQAMPPRPLALKPNLRRQRPILPASKLASGPSQRHFSCSPLASLQVDAERVFLKSRWPRQRHQAAGSCQSPAGRFLLLPLAVHPCRHSGFLASFQKKTHKWDIKHSLQVHKPVMRHVPRPRRGRGFGQWSESPPGANEMSRIGPSGAGTRQAQTPTGGNRRGPLAVDRPHQPKMMSAR